MDLLSRIIGTLSIIYGLYALYKAHRLIDEDSKTEQITGGKINKKDLALSVLLSVTFSLWVIASLLAKTRMAIGWNAEYLSMIAFILYGIFAGLLLIHTIIVAAGLEYISKDNWGTPLNNQGKSKNSSKITFFLLSFMMLWCFIDFYNAFGIIKTFIANII